MQESPGLKGDLFVVISLLSRKNLSIFLKISLEDFTTNRDQGDWMIVF